jgi:hypothetical protein
MFEKITESIDKYKTAKEETKKIQLERMLKLEEQKFLLDIEKLKIETQFMSEGKILPENLDKMSMEQMENSWKDEFIMIILFSPIIFAFFPFVQDTISTGFKILGSDVPDWYTYLVMGIVIVTYGLRGMVKLVVTGKSRLPKISK